MKQSEEVRQVMIFEVTCIKLKLYIGVKSRRKHVPIVNNKWNHNKF